jgi:hypothetical protein
LSPLAEEPGNGTDVQHHHHGLEFEYDCDAPKCGIYVHVLLSKDHPDAPVTSAASPLSKLLIFETVVEGGFGKTLKLEEGAMLDLGRFEYNARKSAPPNPSAAILGNSPATSSPSGDLHDSASPSDAGAPASSRYSRRRFTHFAFRRRSQNRSVSGPALAVVDAEPAPTNDTKDKDDSKDGVRVVIRLTALDEQGTELASPNEQVTYLHVVRFGEEAEEEARPWVVKVVKREATVSYQPDNNSMLNMTVIDWAPYIPSTRDLWVIIVCLSYPACAYVCSPNLPRKRNAYLSAYACPSCPSSPD